jgi:hypothetical protein
MKKIWYWLLWIHYHNVWPLRCRNKILYNNYLAMSLVMYIILIITLIYFIYECFR